MSYSVYILSNVPYNPRDYLEDNQQFLKNLLSTLGYVLNVEFYFCKETRTYKAFIKIRTTVQDIKIICWKKKIYDIDINNSTKISDIKKYLEDNYQNVQFDENNNDKWDEGNYDLKIFPEPIVLLKNFITIKPNWDTNGVEIYMD